MEKVNIIGLIIGLVNSIPGILLVVFYRSLGTKCASTGKQLCRNKNLRPFLFEKLYEERTSRMFVLSLGLWLTSVGVIFIFLLPILITKNP